MKIKKSFVNTFEDLADIQSYKHLSPLGAKIDAGIIGYLLTSVALNVLFGTSFSFLTLIYAIFLLVFLIKPLSRYIKAALFVLRKREIFRERITYTISEESLEMTYRSAATTMKWSGFKHYYYLNNNLILISEFHLPYLLPYRIFSESEWNSITDLVETKLHLLKPISAQIKLPYFLLGIIIGFLTTTANISYR